MLCTDETCQKQIEKDVPRPDPRNRILAMAAACSRVLSGKQFHCFAESFCERNWRFGHSSGIPASLSHGLA